MTNKDEIPAGHENGIHMFGSAAAENLNNPLYVWKTDAPKIYVYYKLNTAAAENNGDDANGAAVTASNFTGGTLALTGVAGLGLGALITALGFTASKKRKEKAAA